MSNNAQPTQSDPMQHQGVTGQSSQKRQNPEKKEAAQNQRGWETTDASNYKRGSQPSQEFKPENTMVIFNFAEYTKSDRETRQLVNETSSQAVVQYEMETIMRHCGMQ